jgi:DNA-binding IclR family transcriptional regulator
MKGTIGVVDGEVILGMRKIERVMLLIQALNNGRFTIKEVASILEVSVRTSYRYLHLLQRLEFEIECDFDKRYFITNGCPFCGSTTNNHEHLKTSGSIIS